LGLLTVVARCQNSNVLPGSPPDASLDSSLFIAMSTSAADYCASPYAANFPTGSLVTVSGLSACTNGFTRVSSSCTGSANCGTFALEA
jgi:hypothetical protein